MKLEIINNDKDNRRIHCTGTSMDLVGRTKGIASVKIGQKTKDDDVAECHLWETSNLCEHEKTDAKTMMMMMMSAIVN